MPAVNVVGVLENQVASRNISIFYIQEFYLMNAMSVESVSNENAIFENIYRSTSTSEYNRFTVRSAQYVLIYMRV
jgi:uncharacterized iron-regulated protein